MSEVPDRGAQPIEKHGFPTVLVAGNNGTSRLVVNRLQLDGCCLVLEAHDEQDALRVAKVHSREIHVLLADQSVNGPALWETLKPYRLEMRLLLVDGQPQDTLAQVRQLFKLQQLLAEKGTT
jgi:hypothetical protein